MNLAAPSQNSAPPRYATPRPSGPTWGPAICRIMDMLGTPAMPWQEYAADVIGELDDNGLPRWPMVLITVPRQAGKTALVLAACVHRLLTAPRRRVWYTAQTGQKARKKWLEQAEIIEGATFPLAGLFTSKRAAGNEQLLLPRLGGVFSPHPPTEDSLHGEQSDLNFIDEGWVFDEAEAAALMAAIVPTQTTRPGAQTIIVSAAGTAASTWFHGLVDKARAGSSDIALLDWGIGPEDDPTDLDVIAAHHPAYGYTLTMDSLHRAQQQLSPAEFARAYGNRRTGSRERFIPLESWTAAAWTGKIPAGAPVEFAAAVDADRTETAIVAGALDVDGTPMVEVIDVRPGTGWAAERLAGLVERHGAGPPWVDPIGPASTLVAALHLMKVDTAAVNTRVLTTAAAEFLDRVVAPDPGIRIRPDSALDTAAEIAEQRRIGEAWAFSRRGAGSIATLEAAALAMHGAIHRPPPPARPLII